MAFYPRAERPHNGIDGIHIVDHFLNNDAVADATLGMQRWEFDTIGNASTVARLALTTTKRPGGVRFTTAATADGDGNSFRSLADSVTFPASSKGGGFAFAFQYPSTGGNALAGNDFWIGVNTSVTATAPTDGISIFSDAGVLNLMVDSNDHGDTTAALSQPATGRTLTSGTTAVLDVIHYVEVIWSGTNGQGGPRFVEAFVDNQPSGSCLCNIDDDETAELKILHYQNSGGAAARILDLLFYEYWQWYDWPTAPAV